jgi:VWFA-related protein
MTTRLSAAAFALACLLPSLSFAQPKQEQIYVSVVDGSGQPVADLTAADFKVREDNVAREVLSAKPATERLSVALMIDNSQATSGATQMIRQGVRDFITALAGKAEIALVTYGDRPSIVVDYTTDQKRLLDGIGRLFPVSGAGTYFGEAIIEVSKGIQKRHPPRPVIVALLVEDDHEFSTRYYDQVLDELQASGASLNVLALGQPSGGLSDELRNRNQEIALGTEQTGGRRDQILAQTAIPGRMKQLADELTHQYVVTYSRPDTLIPPKKVEVTVVKPGATARARTTAPGTGK